MMYVFAKSIPHGNLLHRRFGAEILRGVFSEFERLTVLQNEPKQDTENADNEKINKGGFLHSIFQNLLPSNFCQRLFKKT